MASASRVIDGGCRTYKDSISDAFKSLSTGDKSSLPKPPIPPPSAIPWEVPPKIVSRIPSYLPDPCTIESRRAFLACYVSASQVSVALRRPNILRFNNFMDESLVILETSPDASEHDRIFCQYVHLQRIAEEMAELFAFDDPMARINIKDPTIQHAMKRYGLNLESWRARVKPEYFTPTLKLYYHATVLLCHEVALHRNHNVDDFRMP